MIRLCSRLLMLYACLTSFFMYAEEIRDSDTGVSFPSEITFQEDGKEFKLDATGVATRKKFFVKVYSVASYLQDGSKIPPADRIQALQKNDLAKQLTVKWVHDAPADKVQEGYKESFKNALTDAEQAQLQNDINTFIGFFNKNFNKGDEYTMRWIPGKPLVISFNGTKVGSIENPEFAKSLWKIWFGEKSVLNRNKLAGQS